MSNTNTNTLTFDFQSADQNWADEQTTVWFEMNGTHSGTGLEFDGDVVGFVFSGSNEADSIVDCDGASMTEGDSTTIAARSISASALEAGLIEASR